MKHASMAVTAILVAGLTAAAFAKSPVPANYALWFTSGQVWAFQVDVLTEGLFDEKGKPGSSHKETAALSCKVTAARAFRTVAVSRIECKTKAAKPHDWTQCPQCFEAVLAQALPGDPKASA